MTDSQARYITGSTNNELSSNNGPCYYFIIKLDNESHKFMIQGYSLAKGMGNGKYIASTI